MPKDLISANLLRRLTLTLLFVASCLVFPKLLSWATTEHYGQVLPSHDLFLVVIAPGNEGRAFELTWTRAGELRFKKALALWRLSGAGQLKVSEFQEWRYSVLRSNKGEQIIEVQEATDDHTYWFRYRLTAHGIEPISRQKFVVGHGLAGALLALLVTLAASAVWK